MINLFIFFAAPSLMTSPGTQAHLLDNLPNDISKLVQIVQNLMIHVFWARLYGVELDLTRRSEVRLRTLALKLDRILDLDSRSLTQLREPGKRLVSNCRDFSIMLTGILRHQGLPARTRCGFARYFTPNQLKEHWVCEYWDNDAGRWVLVDSQLDTLQCDNLGITFNPLDVPRDQFIVSGKAWLMCRDGEADPDMFGIDHLRGLWFVRDNLVRDVAALNKVEMLPWDAWGLIEDEDEEITYTDLTALDEMANLTAGDVPNLDQVLRLYESDNRWRVPDGHQYIAR